MNRSRIQNLWKMQDSKMNNNNTDVTLLEGIISLDAAIKAGKREILGVYIDREKQAKRDRKITHLISNLKKSNIPYTICDREYIDTLSTGKSHGGVVAQVGNYTFTDINELLAGLKDNEYLVMLDGVEDPFNFGYSIRNLFAFGCRGFIIPERNWMSAANVVSTSSAGASELCDMAVSHDDDELVKQVKKHGVDIVCSALSKDSVSLFDFKPQKPFVLFIGGEKRGISKTFMENADAVVHIPYSNENARYSLPTASCAAIFASYLSSIK
ncbi:MAG: RNA methyltransferase [Ruminococcaceae bacterium]|nr:RNA methyltransferase [Oscillospiraceae bacterium]